MINCYIDKRISDQFGLINIGVLEIAIPHNVDYSHIKEYTKIILSKRYQELQHTPTTKMLQKWIGVFDKMNANKKRESSVVFLSKWLKEKGKLFDIHPIVDFYNAISVKYGIPMGAYDLDNLVGTMSLRYAKKGEEFVGINGKDVEKTVENEIVYADDIGVTCRFWNDRDCDRTKIKPTTTRCAVFFDGIDDTELIKSAQQEMKQVLKDFACIDYIYSQ